jgi:hypothetical protein
MSTRSGCFARTSLPREVIWVTPRWGRSSSSAWAMWVTAQAIRLAYRVVRPLGSGTCRSSSVTPRTCATLSRTSAEVCGRPSACSSSTGRIMDWKSGTVISVLVVDRQRYSRACELGQARQAVVGRGDDTLSGRRFQCASADPLRFWSPWSRDASGSQVLSATTGLDRRPGKATLITNTDRPCLQSQIWRIVSCEDADRGWPRPLWHCPWPSAWDRSRPL